MLLFSALSCTESSTFYVMLKVRISLCCHSSLCVWFSQMCSRALQASIDTNRLYTVNVSCWVISVSLHWPQCIVEQLLSIQRNIDSSVFPFAVRKWYSKCWSCMVWSMIIILSWLLRIVTLKKHACSFYVRCFDLQKLINFATQQKDGHFCSQWKVGRLEMFKIVINNRCHCTRAIWQHNTCNKVLFYSISHEHWHDNCSSTIEQRYK